MSKILIITANLKDWTKNSGGKERTATLIEALDRYDVTLLSFSWFNEVIDKKLSNGIYQIQPAVKLNVYNKRKRLLNDIAQQNHDIAFELLKDDLSDFSKMANKLAEDSDLVILDHYSLAPLITNINKVPIIYNSHNCELSMAKQLYPSDKEVIDIVRKMEKQAIDKATAITYCSQKDFEEMQDYYGADIKGEYIPNGCISMPKPNNNKRLKSKDILFVGSGHPPNVIAARYIAEMAKNFPEFNFLIAGSASYAINKKNITDNLMILGEVKDEELDKLFKESFAFFNPMTKGSGTHLKMMKALSYGIPIISSTIGARGFSRKTIKSAILIADSTKQFSDAIKKLQDKQSYLKYCEGSYEMSANFDWEKIKSDYVKFISKHIKTDKSKKQTIKLKKQKILISSISRNDSKYIDKYYSKIKNIARKFPEHEFYLSIYENDSDDDTKQKIFSKDYSMFAGVSIISETLNTEYYGSTKDLDRVKNLSIARNKSLTANNFIDLVDYLLVIDVDIDFDEDTFDKVLSFHSKQKNAHIVSATSIRGEDLYDQWATRVDSEYSEKGKEYYNKYKNSEYKKYYSVSNGFCLYSAEPFKKGIRFDYINTVSGKSDCEMVVVCQKFRNAGYENIFMLHSAKVYHNHN